MAVLIVLVIVLICICYLGVGFTAFLILKAEERIIQEIKKEKEKKASFPTRFTVIFLWPILPFGYLFDGFDES